MNEKHVVVAMSGGVDSSVAAAIMVQQGYRVTGIMLKLWTADCSPQENACCTPESINQAREVAGILGIPFYVIDARDEFKSAVVDRYIDMNYQGKTPNPCYWCNQTIRWGYLLDKALALGADFLVTGHYANITKDKNNEYHLYKGVDPKKDQSYVLSGLNQWQLAHTLLPLGSLTKDVVREKAQELKLSVAGKPDSQDLCFIGNNNYRLFLEQYSGRTTNPGNIVDKSGNIIGFHGGLQNYTIGQRKGLGAGNKDPVYVVSKIIDTNEIVVGSKNDLLFTRVKIGPMNWISGVKPQKEMEYEVKIRYKAKPQPGKLSVAEPNYCYYQFLSPVRDATTGQIVVIYDKDEVIGSGEIVLAELEGE